jgi:hypothetical protein
MPIVPSLALAASASTHPAVMQPSEAGRSRFATPLSRDRLTNSTKDEKWQKTESERKLLGPLPGRINYGIDFGVGDHWTPRCAALWFAESDKCSEQWVAEVAVVAAHQAIAPHLWWPGILAKLNGRCRGGLAVPTMALWPLALTF